MLGLKSQHLGETGVPQASWLARLAEICEFSTQVRDPVLTYNVECEWEPGLYGFICTRMYEGTCTCKHTIHMCIYTCKTLKKTKQLWVDVALNCEGGYDTIPGILLRETTDIWSWRRSCDDRPSGCGMWRDCWLWERGTVGQGMWAASPLKAEKGKSQILPGAPGKKEASSAPRLISAQWGALFSDFWHSKL